MKAMKNLRICITVLVMGVTSYSIAQQEAQYTQYLDNMLYYNPAYAGQRDMMNFNLLHRQQWIGFDGAPMTTSFSVHSPLRYESVGLGLSILNDKVGPTNATWINADASYALRFKKHKARLSFGLKGGIQLMNGNLASLTKQDGTDADLNTRYNNAVTPNIGAGIYYHSEQWFLGISIPKILETKQSITDVQYLDQRHYYFTLGGYIHLNRMLKLRPSALFKMTTNSPFAFDANLALIIYDKFWIGANYRLSESAGALVQFSINNQFKIGYAVDIATTKLVRTNYGSHEILLSYDLNVNKKKIISPRFF